MNDYLFVCSVNMCRSPTAEVVARRMGYRADSGGTMALAVRQVTEEQVRRASQIVCMESKHWAELVEDLPMELVDKVTPHVTIWNIPDDYDFMDSELIKMIEARLK